MKASDDEISDDGSLAELAYCCDVHALLLEVHSTYASLIFDWSKVGVPEDLGEEASIKSHVVVSDREIINARAYTFPSA